MRIVRRVWRAASAGERLLLVATLAYLVWPFDVVPEALFGLVGLTDDVVALGVLVATARRVLARGVGP